MTALHAHKLRGHVVLSSVLMFSKLNKMFFGHFVSVNILLDNENKYLLG